MSVSIFRVRWDSDSACNRVLSMGYLAFIRSTFELVKYSNLAVRFDSGAERLSFEEVSFFELVSSIKLASYYCESKNIINFVVGMLLFDFISSKMLCRSAMNGDGHGITSGIKIYCAI